MESQKRNKCQILGCKIAALIRGSQPVNERNRLLDSCPLFPSNSSCNVPKGKRSRQECRLLCGRSYEKGCHAIRDSVLLIYLAQWPQQRSPSSTYIRWLFAGISASGAESCDWMSAITLRKAGTTKTADTSADSRPKLFVTRCILAPGAPLNPLVEGADVLIVGMNNGELVNEKRSPSEPSQCFKWLSDVDAKRRAVPTAEYWKRES